MRGARSGALWVRLFFFRCAAFWAPLAPPLLLACTNLAAAFFHLFDLGPLWSALWPSALAFLMHLTVMGVSLAKKSMR